MRFLLRPDVREAVHCEDVQDDSYDAFFSYFLCAHQSVDQLAAHK